MGPVSKMETGPWGASQSAARVKCCLNAPSFLLPASLQHEAQSLQDAGPHPKSPSCSRAIWGLSHSLAKGLFRGPRSSPEADTPRIDRLFSLWTWAGLRPSMWCIQSLCKLRAARDSRVGFCQVPLDSFSIPHPRQCSTFSGSKGRDAWSTRDDMDERGEWAS